MKLPSGWKVQKFEEITIAATLGITTRGFSGTDTMPLLKMGNLRWGALALANVESIDLKSVPKEFYLESGDLLFNTRNTMELVGKTAVWHGEKATATFDNNLLRVRFHRSVNPDFVCLQMTHGQGKKQLNTLAAGSTSVAAIYWKDLSQYKLWLPGRKEQDEIVKINSAWATAIEKEKRLIEATEHRKKDLAHKLLFGKVRLKGRKTKGRLTKPWFSIPDDWSIVIFGSIAKEISTKNRHGGAIPVLSCTKYQGLVDSLKYFDKQIFSKDTSTYKVVEYGQFAYATNHIEEGSIGYQNLYPNGLVSPMYTVFRTDEKQVNDGYLYKMLKTETYRHIFEANTSASVDRRGSLRWNEFSKLPVPLPHLNEQEEINAVLEIAQKEINLLQRNLELLKEQKNALMQKLLTGELRIKTVREVS